MQNIRLFFKRKENMATILVSMVLVGLILSLLRAYHLSQLELRKYSLNQLKHSVEKSATALSYFYAERNHDINTLSASREITTFFENKALGMSMEYGLRASLIGVAAVFNRLLDQRVLGEDRIYKRIIFINKHGELLIDTSAPDGDGAGKDDWKAFLRPEQAGAEPRMERSGSGCRIVTTSAYFFKNKYAGQIIAWVSQKTLFDHLFKSGHRLSGRLLYIDFGTDNDYISPHTQTPPFQPPILDLRNTDPGKRHHFKVTTNEGDQVNMLGVRVPVNNTPFYFINVVSTTEIFGPLAPSHLPLVMGLLSLIVLGGSALILWNNMRNMLLYVRLEEESKGRREIEAKNLQLEKEFSERKAMEEALYDSEQTFRKITASAQDAILMMDNEGKISFWNEAAEKIFGYRKSEILGQELHAFLGPRRYYKEYQKGFGKFKTSGQGDVVGKTFELRALRKNGAEFSIEIALSAVKLKGMWNAIGIVRDITDRKVVEKKLRNAKETAEAANHAKSSFLANMSHELRTPLNHIIGFTQLVVEKSFGELNTVQEEYLGDVLSSSKHLLSLINDILDLTKVEAGKLELTPTDVNIEELMENCHIMVKEKTMKHGIELSMDIKDAPHTVKADERKMKQIMYNLISNAVKFTPDGGVIALVAKLRSATMEENPKKRNAQTRTQSPISQADQKAIEISVQDTGIGIKREDLGRIFQPFEQVEDSINRRFQGTGLGLSLTKSLVELHGGKLRAQSEGEGKGSIFSFTVPIEMQSKAPNENVISC